VLLPLAIVTAGTWVLVAPTASSGADQLASAKAQAAQIEAQIQSEGQHIDALSQQYDAANYELQEVDGRITTAQAQLTRDQAQVTQDELQLRQQAVRDYMINGTSDTMSQLFSGNQDASEVRNEYDQIATGNVDTTVSTLHTAQTQLQSEQASLRGEQSQAQAARASAATSQQQAQSAIAAQKVTLSSVNASINALIVQQQQAEAAAAEAAFNQKVASERAAAAQAAARAPAAVSGTASGQHDVSTGTTVGGVHISTGPAGGGGGGSGSGGGSGPQPIVLPPPPPANSAGQAAVNAAETQLGVPYVWGGETPGVGFDCSGLVAWAWGQAGHPLPHYSGAQYEETTPVPLADIEPGDLLFYGPGGDTHVAMYIGGGEMIEAPYTGAWVHNTPVRTDDGFVGVGRVE